jgi:transcriptional regulator with XRE-family HTH domain
MSHSIREYLEVAVEMKRLRERRKALGMSQATLAKKIGINQAQISKYEVAENAVSSEVLAELARILDVSSDWLLGLTDEVMPSLREENLNMQEQAVVSALRQGKPLKAIKTIVKDAEDHP